MASLNFNAKVISEPELEFGAGGRHVDPRFGLVEHGPLQPMLGDTVRIGVIGTGDTAEGFAQFIERCRVGIDGKNQKLANLYPPFPGVGNQNPFRCTFEVDQIARRIVPEKDIRRIIEMRKQSEAVTAAATWRVGAAPYVDIAVLTAVATLLRDVTSVSGAPSQLRDSSAALGSHDANRGDVHAAPAYRSPPSSQQCTSVRSVLRPVSLSETQSD